jgi:hypothetical protein
MIHSKKSTARKVKRFTQIRTPYKSYLLANWSWNDVFDELDSLKETSTTYLKDTAIKYGILYKTLANKYGAYCKDKEKILLQVNNENRGGSNKAFSLQQEKELYDIIKINYINNNKPLTNEIIKELAIKNHKLSNNNNNFNASDGWCSSFKKKWNLSTQKVKPNKMASKLASKSNIDQFLDEYNDLKLTVKKSSYLTMMKRILTR